MSGTPPALQVGAAPPRPPDLRLAGFAAATWLSALTALYLTAYTALTVGAAAAALAIAVAVAATRLRSAASTASARVDVSARSSAAGRWWWLPAVRWLGVAMLLGVAVGSIATGARVSVRDAEPLATLVRQGATVRADLVVRDDPRALRGSPGLPPTYLIAVDLVAVHTNEPAATIRLSARALVLAGNRAWRTLLPGQRLTAAGRLAVPRGGDLRAAVLRVKEAPEVHGRPPWVQRAAGSLRAGLQRACAPLPDDAGGLLPGLVVGDTSRLDPAVEEDFRTTGMTHLNAVSGANVQQTDASSIGR